LDAFGYLWNRIGHPVVILMRQALLHSAVISGDIREAGPRDEHLERLLDQALEATFPASDPIAVSVPENPVNPR
jgi:hypothetical protein